MIVTDTNTSLVKLKSVSGLTVPSNLPVIVIDADAELRKVLDVTNHNG